MPGISSVVAAGLFLGTSMAIGASPDEEITCGSSYIVRINDTLSGIASRTCSQLGQMSVADILDANTPGISDPDRLAIGDKLRLPCPKSGPAKVSLAKSCYIKSGGVCAAIGVKEGSIMPDISPELCRRFDQNTDSPDHREEVIVTLAPDGDAEDLKRLGMEITSQMRNVPIVTGSITVITLTALSGLESVVRVEMDSPDMRALDE